MRHVTDDERRARLAVRHALAPAYRVGTAEAATRAMTVLHATEASSVYLSCWARVDGLEVADLDRALYEDRSLVKQLAMRRTLFVFPRDLLPAAWSSAAARVAAAERTRIEKGIVKVGIAADGEQWLEQARAEVLAVLADSPDGCTTSEVRAAVPMIDVKVELSAGQTFTAGGRGCQLGGKQRISGEAGADQQYVVFHGSRISAARPSATMDSTSQVGYM